MNEPLVDIVYEDAHLLAINKPPGLLVHPDGIYEGPTLVDWIVHNRPEIKGVGETLRLKNNQIVERPGIVHRLDRETSGIMLIAKTPDSFRYFKEAFQERRIEKTYNAFLYGILSEKEGVIDKDIAKSSTDFRKWSAEPRARGKKRDALTEYSVLQEDPNISHASGQGVSFVEARPKTGRTHQIRVHFKALHHPVVCDSLYAPNHECILGFDRLALHARSLSFVSPDGTRLTLEAGLPPDFVTALKSFI